jgi:hypothetical protein
MPTQPLAEVFGYPVDNLAREAKRHRDKHLCPYNNVVAKCTKNSIDNPLGVCSVFSGSEPVITCPVRFREDWIAAKDAASFFFSPGTKWVKLNEVTLHDKTGREAGNIDVVLAAIDKKGEVLDFGALEVQAVYISGNVRDPFKAYMKKPSVGASFDWRGKPKYPRPDYLSSSRKRLVPQLIFKGGILKTWGKKVAVALNTGFFQTLPTLTEVAKEKAEVAWLVYDLKLDPNTHRYKLERNRIVYTLFTESLEKISKSEAGNKADFIARLQERLRHGYGKNC